MVTSSLNGVDSFAWVALFRYRKGVLLKTAKTAVFAAKSKSGRFLAGGPLLQSTARSLILNELIENFDSILQTHKHNFGQNFIEKCCR